MAHRNSKTPRTYIEGFIAAAVTDKTQKAPRTRQAVERTPDLPDTTNVSNRNFGHGQVNSLKKQAANDSYVTPRQMIEDFMRSNQTVVASVRGKRGRSLDQSIVPSESSSVRSTRSSFPSIPNISRYGEKETPRTYIEGYLASVGSDVEETPALLPKRKKPLNRRSVQDIPSFSATRSYSSILNDSPEEELADQPQQIRWTRTRNKIELQVPTKDSVDVNDVDVPLQKELQRFKRPRTRNRIQLSVPPRQNEATKNVAEVEILRVDTPGAVVRPPAEQNALETPEVGDHTRSPENNSPLDHPPGEHITETIQEMNRERETRLSAAYEHEEPLPSSDYTKRTSLPPLQTSQSPIVTRPIFKADLQVKPVELISGKKGNQSLYSAPCQTLVSPKPVLPQSVQVSMPDVGLSPTSRVLMSQLNGTPQLTVPSSQLEAKSSRLSQSSVTHSLSQHELQTRATDEHLEDLPSSAYTERTSLHQLEVLQSPILTESISLADFVGNSMTPLSARRGKKSSFHGSLSQTLVSPHIVVTPKSVRDLELDREKVPTYQVMSEQNGNPQITDTSSQLVATSSYLSQSKVTHASSQQEIHTGETMGSVAFGQKNRSGFAALHRSSIPLNSEKEVGPSLVLAASPGIVRTSTPVDDEVHIQKTKRRKRKANTVDYTIPPSVVKKLLAIISKLKFSKEAVEEVCIWSEKYFDQMVKDLEAFAVHAGRKTITEADVELLIRRQGFVTEKRSLTSLIEQYLPHEYRSLLIPIARSGNHIEPM
ncbi:hypothetical protein CHS0354_006197 [Potamilus streckersoni]|uniref:CENP-T/Histone H4 histone fold domain-containing protein n=1 Tax=Potamilus streckersoni TaxID=2493646 RepID=A0AAE0SS77_9BIVA|nr:hypothetical protein CHS0354_006197 [Potamilus streckersoni]